MLSLRSYLIAVQTAARALGTARWESAVLSAKHRDRGYSVPLRLYTREFSGTHKDRRRKSDPTQRPRISC
ncbi:hypothetical protein A5625_26630 [Mycobacterium sp. 1465703.0]|nr:hypothetical protein A5625_26630 [Mycobacterium sp. 1465703.0]